mgnify:CR=1 FL=1
MVDNWDETVSKVRLSQFRRNFVLTQTSVCAKTRTTETRVTGKNRRADSAQPVTATRAIDAQPKRIETILC